MEVRKKRGKWEPAIGRLMVFNSKVYYSMAYAFTNEARIWHWNLHVKCFYGAMAPFGRPGCFLFAVFTWCKSARWPTDFFLSNINFRTLVCVGTGSFYCFMVNLISMDRTWHTTFASTIIWWTFISIPQHHYCYFNGLLASSNPSFAFTQPYSSYSGWTYMKIHWTLS